MAINPENKDLAKYLRSRIGTQVSVDKYWDKEEHSNVDILSVKDAPSDGIRSFATLGLSDHPIELSADDKPLRIELLIAAGEDSEVGANILATCAFNIINSGMKIGPGAAFTHVVDMYRPESAMKHILFVPPFVWELDTQYLTSKTVAWLQAVPISDSEYQFAMEHGHDALETKFEVAQIDVFDLDRASIV